MKRFLLIMLAAGVAACQPNQPAPEGDVLATVNGQPIDTRVFDTYLERRTGDGAVQLNPEEQAELLNQIINVELLAQAAAESKLDKDPQTAAQIQIQRTQFLANAAIMHFLDNNPVTDDALQAEYEQRVGSQPRQEYKARHILVKTEQEAGEIVTALDKGGDFTALATRSIEPGAAERGGDLGWFIPDQMVKPFADAVQAMEPGSHSKTPVQTQFGWHVIKLEERRDVEPPSFDELKPQLRSRLEQESIANYVTRLREAAQINIAKPEAPENMPAGGEAEEEAGGK